MNWRKLFVKELPETIAVTFREGGAIVPFGEESREIGTLIDKDRKARRGILVHAVFFEDGSVWDAYNGWRISEP